MKRLYYLTHSVDEADALISDLRRAGVGEWHIHGLSADDAGLYHHHIHPVHFFQRYNLIYLGERGALIGLALSLIWSLATHSLQLIPDSFGHAEMLFTVLLFTLFGAWSGGLAGMSRLNYRIARFQKDIDSGACLVLVDIPKKKVNKVRRAVQCRHPGVILAGHSSTFTNPFAKATQPI
ncbi:hypothetical protein [Sansalvadorimonas verongulae]|uniref:hypothetical protein n=1 Tax=Sansalvadorimonas verongulae TaxID=2172824 RepID=UPI0012BCD4BB|nr:hypothetical protein [Sansalvadorimonas verongulae]MTI12614.1 hypothetical protein [Sansalvadorimonas verongulae]